MDMEEIKKQDILDAQEQSLTENDRWLRERASAHIKMVRALDGGLSKVRCMQSAEQDRAFKQLQRILHWSAHCACVELYYSQRDRSAGNVSEMPKLVKKLVKKMAKFEGALYSLSQCILRNPSELFRPELCDVTAAAAGEDTLDRSGLLRQLCQENSNLVRCTMKTSEDEVSCPELTGN